MKEVWNILPINDLEEHRESPDCKCEPRLEEYDTCILIIHNSYDGREAVEWANDILGNI